MRDDEITVSLQRIADALELLAMLYLQRHELDLSATADELSAAQKRGWVKERADLSPCVELGMAFCTRCGAEVDSYGKP